MMTTARFLSSLVVTGLCSFLPGLSAASSSAPSNPVLLIHGHIYTANPQAPWAEALLIKGSKIAAVGTDKALLAGKPAAVRVIDLKGQTVIPGLIDAHMHLLFGALEIAGFNLSTPERSLTPEHPEELIDRVKDYAQSHRNERLLIGRADFSSQPPYSPTRQLLDRAVSDRPVVVHNSTEHSLWLNSKALALAGISTQPVADPDEERGIVRDASGNPSGVLLEAAQEIAERAVLAQYTVEEKLSLIRHATAYLNSNGITSVINATGDLSEIELYGQLRDRGELTVRTKTAFGAVAVPHKLTPEFLADLESARSRFHDEWVSANLVKFFADGSSGMIPPLVYRPADYKALVLELDRRGFQLMTHAQRGDSVHMILSAYDHAARTNGPRDRRLRIEHAFVVTDEDAASMARLSVIAGAQPVFCCSELGTNYDPADPTPSDRWNTLLNLGVTLAFGSDWPCSWPNDPFVNIQQAVTRQIWRSPDTAVIETEPFDGANNGGAKPLAGKIYTPEERISVRQAVDSYTRGAAYSEFAEDRVGTLEVGKNADLAVLSQDLFSVAAEDIAKTKVTMTLVGGKVVYEAGSALKP